jgi:hypothetical protein
VGDGVGAHVKPAHVNSVRLELGRRRNCRVAWARPSAACGPELALSVSAFEVAPAHLRAPLPGMTEVQLACARLRVMETLD